MPVNTSYLGSSASLLAEIADSTAVIMDLDLASQGIEAGGQVSRSNYSSKTESTDSSDIAARTAALIGKIKTVKGSTPRVTAESTADLVARINALTGSMSQSSTAGPEPEAIEAAVELEVGCMLREMGFWCVCCDE